MTDAITCTDLSKAYGRGTTALHGITFAVPRGAAFGLLGENGAGKSTLVRLLMGFLRPTAGRLTVLGETDVTRAHPRVGYVHEQPIFDPRFTARDYLAYWGQLAGLVPAAVRRQSADLLAQVNLTADAGRAVGGYSKGMRQRLAIAGALLGTPDLLILDEVTSGIDPGSQWDIRQVLRNLHARGTTIFLCSHHLPEVADLCDQVGILRHGRLIKVSPLAQLLDMGAYMELVPRDPSHVALLVGLPALRGMLTPTPEGALRFLAAHQGTVLAAVVEHAITIQSLNPAGASLEDVYLRLTRTPPVGGRA